MNSTVAAHNLAGDVDLVVRGPRAGFSEDIYPEIARLPQVQAASPGLELDVPLAGHRGTLKIIGIDPLRALPASSPDCWRECKRRRSSCSIPAP